MFFSNPQKEHSACKVIKLDINSISANGCKADYITDFFEKRQIPTREDAELLITAAWQNTRAMTYVEESRTISDEKYTLDISEKDGKAEVQIGFGGMRGLYYALCDIFRSINSGSFRVGKITEYPLFPMRGYIEGFYGAPWEHEQRLQMLEWLSTYRMNTYFYAPKDDPYHRDRWSELYPPRELEHLRSVVDKAKECCVDFWFCIAPGLDICYTDAVQFEALRAKCMQLYSVGVSRFGLLLDDIPEQLHFAQDVQAYGETVNAHIDLVNRLYDALKSIDPCIEMVVCPMQYHGKGDEYYISKLGKGIDGRIHLFWTGHNICSQELTVPEAICFAEHTRHKPLYWDNYPVNDAEMYNEMHLGWYDGRDPDLYRYAQGVIVNCMPYFACNRIPLLTVVDYLWNPIRYDPERSWEYALRTVTGTDADNFVWFAEHVTMSCLKTPVSARMADALYAFDTTRRINGVKAATLHLKTYTEHIEKCCAHLNSCKDKQLYTELWRWIEKFFVLRDILSLCCSLLDGSDPNCKPQIQQKLQQFMRLPEVMTDFAFQAAVETILNIEEL